METDLQRNLQSAFVINFKGFPSGANGKESACQCRRGRDVGSIPRSGRSPGVGKQPTPVFLPGKFHGQRSLEDYSPWVAESQTRALSMHT